jgi:chromosome segregation ATPase
MADMAKTPDTLAERLAVEGFINPDDRREIETEIETLSRNNKFSSDSGEAALKPLKRELLFPLIVNAVIVGFAVVFIGIVSQLFLHREDQRSRLGNGFSSVEGQLLSQLREEVESQIMEKEREIFSIRESLASVDRDESLLAQDLEARYRRYEAELNAALDQELNNERQRLSAMGLSGDEIRSRLAAVEQTAAVSNRETLKQFRAELDAEQEAAAENFARLRTQYQENLRGLNEERRNLQGEFRQKEQKLRIGAAPVPAELDERQALAQEEFTVLESQSQKEQMTEAHVLAMYSHLQESFSAGRFAEAETKARSMAEYLEQQAGSGAVERQHKLSVDIFIAQTLAQMARLRQEESAVPVSALEEVPPGPDLAAVSAAAAEIERARDAANQEDFPAALNSYRAAGALLGLSEGNTAVLIEGIEAMNRVSANAGGSRRQQSAAAEPLLSRGNQQLSAGLYREALGSFSQLAVSYPLASQHDEAVRNMDQVFQAYVDYLAVQSREVLAAQVVRTETGRQTEDQQAAVVQLQSRIAVLEAENARLNRDLEAVRQNASASSEEIGRLRNSADAYQAIVTAYNGYARTNAGMSELETFLAVPQVGTAFPQFASRIKKMAEDMANAGHKEGISNVTYIMDVAFRIKTTETRQKYLQGMKTRYQNEPNITAFIDVLLQRLI